MDVLNRAYSQLHALYRSMTPGSRLTAGLLLAVVLVGLGYMGTQQVARPEVDLLHGAPVAAGQLLTMEAAFGKANLKGYEVRGASIFVPRGQESTYIAALAAAGALPPNMGEIINAAGKAGNLFESESQRKARMKIATQAELAMQICLMPGIERAFVLYDEDSKPGGFKDKVVTATASVKPAGSDQLEPSRVTAIRHLVAGAIANLKPENVTISDLNGRTVYGNAKGDGIAEENLYISLKRTYEQELKAKILNVLCYIPNVAVELNVDLDRERVIRTKPAEKEGVGLTPISARVSVGVPISYLKKVWQSRNTVALGHVEKTPDPAAIEQIRIEEFANIQRCVTPLLPPAKGVTSLTDMVTVTTFQEVAAAAPLTSSLSQDVLNWAVQSWKTLGGVALGLVVLLVLRSIVRVNPADADEQASTPHVEVHAAPAKVAAPHWRRNPAVTVAQPLREELSSMVEDDPETAANILRNWIGQVG